MVPAGFEDVVEADEVALDVGIGVDDAVADTGLCSEVDDDLGCVCREYVLYLCLVGDVAFDKGELSLLGFLDFFQAFFLQADVVVVVEVVDADDSRFREILQQSLDEVGTDETGCACHEDGFGG